MRGIAGVVLIREDLFAIFLIELSNFALHQSIRLHEIQIKLLLLTIFSNFL
jgi:hypothetical protein